MTRRDLQRAMGDQKTVGRSARALIDPPIDRCTLAAQTGHFSKGAIWLKVNGETKQNANLDQMIWNVAEQISKLFGSQRTPPGDIIFSGTPENVGLVVKGDTIVCGIDGFCHPCRSGIT